MKEKERQLVKNTVLFSIGNLGAKLLVFLITPLYTYYITTEQMGQYDVTYAYANLFVPIACISIYEGVYRWLLDKNENRGDVLKNGTIILISSLAVFDVISFLVTQAISYEYYLYFLLFVNSYAIYTYVQFVTRGMLNNWVYAIQGIVYSICLVICNWILIIGLRLQARGLLLSMSIAFIASSIFMIVSQKKEFKRLSYGNPDIKMTGQLLKYSLPIVPNNIAWWLVSASNSLIINLNLGDAANGVYSIAMKFPLMVNMISTFFYQAWQEQSITEYNSKERDDYYTKIFNVYDSVLLSGIMMLLPISNVIIHFFMDISYVEASKYICILYLSSTFSAFASFYGTGYLSTKKTTGTFYTTICGAVVNVILTIVLINNWGLFAAAVGNMLGNLTIWIIRIIQTRQFFLIKINKIKILILIIANIGCAILVEFSSLSLLVILQLITIFIFLLVNKKLLNGVLKNLPFRRKE